MAATDFWSIARDVVEMAKVHGATHAEAYVSKSKELEVEVRGGKIETIKSAEDKGLGLRVFTGNQAGFAYTTDLSEKGIKSMVLQALANARQVAGDEYYRLPEPPGGYTDMVLFDEEIERHSIEDRIAMAQEMERAAREYDPRVKIIEGSTYQDGEVEVGIVNDRGLEACYRGSACGLYISLTAQEGDDSQTGFALSFGRRYRALDPVAVGREAAERAIRMLGAKSQPSQEVPIVFDPFVVVSLLGVVAPALTGEAVQKGRSLFAGKVNEKVASDLVTVVDDGTLEDGIRSAPFDGEGVPTSRTVLIESGQLRTFLHNTYTAAKDGTSSTGNGVRASFKSTPEVGTTNFYIMPGNVTPEALIGDVQSGFYVSEVMGIHTANPISGDFSVGAAGLWIEKGRFAYPVRGVAIAGNIKDLLQRVDAVGNDLRFFGGKGAPTLRVAKMALSGS
ncbi:MAG: TldD/PmbA family protein [Peptococcaceae bacterium]|nr:TldD/PmbA family protein [Peptococcaceae bacterium]